MPGASNTPESEGSKLQAAPRAKGSFVGVGVRAGVHRVMRGPGGE